MLLYLVIGRRQFKLVQFVINDLAIRFPVTLNPRCDAWEDLIENGIEVFGI
ncbi:hypothetical protein D3C86_1460980 [compost metagenome]